MAASPADTANPFRRAHMLQRLAQDDFDVLVIGAGITGAGVALDAASRGLRTAIVEQYDFASGTSSKSSKLVHGGLRYLQQGDVSLVYQALHERRRLLANAPHLVDIQPFLLPLFAKDGLIPKKLSRTLGAAMWAYDATGGWRIGKFHQRIDTAEAIAHMPTLPADKIGGAYIYYDAAADDARLVLTVIRTAAVRVQWARLGLDTAILMLGFCAFFWFFVIAPTAAAQRDPNVLKYLLAQSYIALNCLMLLACGVLLMHSGATPIRRRALMLLTLGFSSMSLADIVWAMSKVDGSYIPGSVSDVIYLSCYVWLAAAAREQLMTWGARNNVAVVAQDGGDAAAVIFDAAEAGKLITQAAITEMSEMFGAMCI